MSAPRDLLTPGSDTALLQLVQQFNQSRIIGKLLHDLRNPLHSLRIAVELFGRIARDGAENPKLLEKAGRYVTPAENAVTALARQVDRTAMFVGAPRAVAIEPLTLAPWLADIATLLRESTLHIDTSIQSNAAEDAAVLADAPRLSHAVVHWALTRLQRCSVRAVVSEDAVQLHIGGDLVPVREGAVAEAELQRLIEQAGAAAEIRDGTLTIALKRAAAPSR